MLNDRFDWTPEALAVVEEMYYDGATSPAIAAEVNRIVGGNVTNGHRVRHVISRVLMGERAERAEERHFDREARIDKALELTRRGFSMREIAVKLRVSLPWVYKVVPEDERPNEIWADKLRLGAMHDRHERSLRAAKSVPPDPIVDAGRTFMEKQQDDCSWPIGLNQDGERMFCLGKRHGRSSYCAEHKQRSLA